MEKHQNRFMWKSNWAEALVMLPCGLIVAIYSAHFGDGRGLISIFIGVVIIRIVYSQVILKKLGIFRSISRGTLAIWLFSVQIALVFMIGMLISIRDVGN